jgi:hypothetical protein
MRGHEPPVRPFAAARCRSAIGLICLLALSGACGCEPENPQPSVPDPAPAVTDADITSTPEPSGRRGYEIPIPQLEFWAEDPSSPKYRYEMRFDPPAEAGGRPRLHRNGWAWAYYLGGGVEREGAYRFIAEKNRSERVGRWTYYNSDGSIDRVEDRGGEVIWTAPDQAIPPPGTDLAAP